MMNINSKMFQKIKDPEYRKLFIAGQIRHGFSTQLRALRKKRDMTQQELAELAETTQTVISRIENNGAANLSVQSLLKIAHAFDVALVVRLEPIDKLVDWVDNLSPEVMSPEASEKLLADIEREALEREASRNELPDATHHALKALQSRPDASRPHEDYTQGLLRAVAGTGERLRTRRRQGVDSTQRGLNFHISPVTTPASHLEIRKAETRGQIETEKRGREKVAS